MSKNRERENGDFLRTLLTHGLAAAGGVGAGVAVHSAFNQRNHTILRFLTFLLNQLDFNLKVHFIVDARAIEINNRLNQLDATGGLALLWRQSLIRKCLNSQTLSQVIAEHSGMSNESLRTLISRDLIDQLVHVEREYLDAALSLFPWLQREMEEYGKHLDR